MENIEVQEVNTDISIQLSEGTFAVLNELIVVNNYFQLQAQKSLKEFNDNLINTLEFSNYKPSEYFVKDIKFDTKELVLVKKSELV